MTENNDNINHRTDCDLFGNGFSWESDKCALCERVSECMPLSEHEKNQIRVGIQPKIPKAINPQMIPFLHVTKPIETSDEIVLTLRFHKLWMKKLLRWEGDAKALNAEFIFKLREQVRIQFANRPEIIAELDALLGGF